MGTEIPIFFLPVEPRMCVLNCDDVHQLIEEGYAARERFGLRVCISRNWWHLSNLQQSAAARNSCAFDFLDETMVCLDTASIVKAIQTLAEVLAEASAGLTSLAATCTAEANEFFLNLESDDTSNTNVSPEAILLRAFLEAKASHDVPWSGDAGYSASVGYFAFLKSLMASLVDCLNAGKFFLYYRPQ